MSHLKEMMSKLNRLKRAERALVAAQQAVRQQFQVGSRAEFDPGEGRLLGCTVVATSPEFIIVKADVPVEEIKDLFWKTYGGNIYVAFSCAFTPEAAAEMHAVRDPVLESLGH